MARDTVTESTPTMMVQNLKVYGRTIKSTARVPAGTPMGTYIPEIGPMERSTEEVSFNSLAETNTTVINNSIVSIAIVLISLTHESLVLLGHDQVNGLTGNDLVKAPTIILMATLM